MNCNCNNRKGVTLSEIMLALFIISAAFLPIMGAMSTGVRGTQKDETVLRGVQLAQKTLNIALQIPFKDLVNNRGGGTGSPWSFGTAGTEFSYATGTLNLRLGKVLEGPLEYTLNLEIRDVPFFFTLSVHDPMARSIATETPAAWGWQGGVRVPRTGEMKDLYHRYALTATWVDRDNKESPKRIYRIVSYKALLNEP